MVGKLSLLGGLKVAVKKANHGVLSLEGRVLLFLQGRNPCIPFLFGMVDDRTMVMELVDDKDCTMHYHIKSKSFSHFEWIEICARIAEALAFIHQQGILHNDLHSKNVLITKERVPKIVDFGSATLCRHPRQYFLSEDEKKTYAARHSHIAWELRSLSGKKQNELTDVYSFGRLLKAVVRDCKIVKLVPISDACRDHEVARRPSAEFLVGQIRDLGAV